MKPRCQGHHDGGAHTSFLCVLDEGHDGFCKPYVPPTVDEWRASQFLLASAEEDARFYAGRTARIEEACRADVARLQAENDALRAIIESGCGQCAAQMGLNTEVVAGVVQPRDGALRMKPGDDSVPVLVRDGAYMLAHEAPDDLRGLAGKVKT